MAALDEAFEAALDLAIGKKAFAAKFKEFLKNKKLPLCHQITSVRVLDSDLLGHLSVHCRLALGGGVVTRGDTGQTDSPDMVRLQVALTLAL